MCCIRPSTHFAVITRFGFIHNTDRHWACTMPHFEKNITSNILRKFLLFNENSNFSVIKLSSTVKCWYLSYIVFIYFETWILHRVSTKQIGQFFIVDLEKGNPYSELTALYNHTVNSQPFTPNKVKQLAENTHQ